MNISNNVIIGAGSGTVVATGADNNILIGYSTGSTLTTGSDNILIGYNVEPTSATASDELNIGDLITGDLSGKTVDIDGDLTADSVVVGDHGTAATDEVVNVCYGTGDPPTASTTTIGTIYVKYTA